jgi:hypothetical protein
MSMTDLYNDIGVVRAISSVSVADDTPQVSEIIDRADYESLTFVTNIGSVADSNATFTVLVEDGDESNMSDAAAVSDDFLIGTEAEASFTFADDNETRKIGYVGQKRYVRYTVTPAGNASAALFGVLAILGSARNAPVA